MYCWFVNIYPMAGRTMQSLSSVWADDPFRWRVGKPDAQHEPATRKVPDLQEFMSIPLLL